MSGIAQGEDVVLGSDRAGADPAAGESPPVVADQSPDAREPSAEADQGAAREITTESVVEALLFASDEPLTGSRIAQILGVGDARSVRRHIDALNAGYERIGASFRIEVIAKGYQLLTLPDYHIWLTKLSNVRRESSLSPAALETLAVVAYKQPVLRADIEAVRGVACGEMLQRLRQQNLIKIVGRAEEIGRPILYGTTNRFLKVFGLASLAELPHADVLTPPKERDGTPPSDG